MGALTYVSFLPDSIWSSFTVLPIQIFNWVSRPQRDFHANAAAGILVLMALLLTMNAVAIWLRDRYQRKVAAMSVATGPTPPSLGDIVSEREPPPPTHGAVQDRSARHELLLR